MKNIIALILMFTTACNYAYGQKVKGFELKGNIEGLKDGTKMYLVTSDVDTIGKAISDGSTFEFKGYVTGEANYYFIRLDTNINKKFSEALWLINSKLSITGKLYEWPHLVLNGSEPQDVWLAFKDLQEKNLKKEGWNEMVEEFIKAHLTSLFVPYIIKVLPASKRDEIYSLFNELLKKSFYGKEAEKYLQFTKLYTQIQNSGTIPNFNLTTTVGIRSDIYELASKSKYTLIDFWASWCKPCREGIPELKRVYEAFHSLGFNIVGVSTDKSETAWKKAISNDKTLWTHGIDNIDYAGKNIFNLLGIPSYVLIDQRGKIIQSELFIPNSETEQIRKFKNKNLSRDLYEIIEELLGK